MEIKAGAGVQVEDGARHVQGVSQAEACRDARHLWGLCGVFLMDYIILRTFRKVH